MIRLRTKLSQLLHHQQDQAEVEPIHQAQESSTYKLSAETHAAVKMTDAPTRHDWTEMIGSVSQVSTILR